MKMNLAINSPISERLKGGSDSLCPETGVPARFTGQGTAFIKCAVKYCNLIGAKPLSDTVFRKNLKPKIIYCKKHFRFYQMIHGAKLAKKYVPEYYELDKLFQSLKGFTCKGCGKIMRWLSEESSPQDVISLQHNRDGSLDLICKSCNFRFKRTKKKICHKCKIKKKISEFYNVNKNSKIRIMPICKKCSKEKNLTYYYKKLKLNNL